MCEDRERLIGYVYDECDSAERRTIEAHLGDCVDCRDEVRALRATRQDLLAWEVPQPGLLWRPMPQPRSSWQQLPVWAMAAAAAVILVVGAAGGAVTQALLPAPGGAPSQVATVAPTTRTQDEHATIAALEQRVRDLETSNATMGELVRVLSNRPAASSQATPVNVNAADLAQQIRQLAERQDELSRTVMTMGMETVDLKNRQVGLQKRNEMLVSYTLGQNAGGR